MSLLPWLVWLSGLSVSLQNERLLILPHQGKCLGCWPGPQLKVWERHRLFLSHIDVSLSFSLLSPLSKNK